MPAFRRLAAALLATTLAAVPAAAVKWTSRTHEVRLGPLQTEVPVVFSFVNDTGRTVAITDVKTNCDCLEARPDKPSYADGEPGRIDALFTVGDRLGLYERAITVTTSAGGEPVRLTVRVEVPAPAAVEPRELAWTRESAAEPRTTIVTVDPALTIDFTEAIATTGDFEALLEPIEPGRRYGLRVTPRSTAAPASAAIRLRGREKSGRPITISAYATVR